MVTFSTETSPYSIGYRLPLYKFAWTPYWYELKYKYGRGAFNGLTFVHGVLKTGHMIWKSWKGGEQTQPDVFYDTKVSHIVDW